MTRSGTEVSSYQRAIGMALRKKIGVVGGRPVFLIAGGSESAPEGGGAGEGGAEGGAEGEGEPKEGEPTGEGEGEPEGDKEKPPKDDGPKPGEDRGAYRARKRAQEATERAERAERELEELRDKDRTETERLSGRATKAEGRVKVLEGTVTSQAIHIAFLLASAGDGNRRKPINWVDPEDALTLARKELDGIKVGDDGEIDQDEVRAVVDDLAKRKPHLIRRQQQQTPSGGNVGAGQQQTPKEQSAEELAKTYGALRTRL